jgi:tryptophan synthase alpha chain
MQKCKQAGIDGVIVPDLPYEERDELSAECAGYGIKQIPLIAPTSGNRIEKIAKDAEGFIYCVSSLGVTGVRNEINTDVADMIAQIKEVSQTPCAVGFGVSTPEQAQALSAVSDGVIIGSAVVKIIAEHGKECVEPVKEFVMKVKSYL